MTKDTQAEMQLALDTAFAIFITEEMADNPMSGHPAVLSVLHRVFVRGFNAAYATYMIELASLKAENAMLRKPKQ
jgi:hypothetical protein